MLSDCVLCPNMLVTRLQVVESRGPDNARILCVGQAPGWHENQRGVPFIGKSGEWLDNLLRLHAQIDPTLVRFTNTARCYPGRKGELKWLQSHETHQGFQPTGKGDRPPSPAEIETCTEMWLWPEVAAVNPELIITLGQPALSAFMPGEHLDQVHGQALTWDSPDGTAYMLMPMYHPAAAAYNPALKPVLVTDFGKLHESWPPPTWGVTAGSFTADVFGFDTETTTPEVGGEFAPLLARTIGFSTAAHTDAGLWAGYDTGRLDKIRTALQNPDQSVAVHNGKFEIILAQNEGIRLHVGDDTQVMLYLLGYKSTSLKNGSGSVLGVRQQRFSEWDGVSLEYPAADAACTLLLRDKLLPQLEADGLMGVYRDIEMPLIPVMAAMERKGVRLDEARLHEVEAQLEIRLAQLEAAYPDVRMSSRDSKAAYLFDELGLPPGKPTDTGKRSVRKGVLEGIDHDAARDMLEWAQTAKLVNAYTKSLPGFVYPDGRLHPQWNQAGGYEDHEARGDFAPRTGRISCRNPNLMQIPHRTALGRLVRSAIVPEEGKVFVRIDIDQEEARIAAFLADDTSMQSQFVAGMDVYRPIAQQLYDITSPQTPWNMLEAAKDEVKRWRDPAKQLFLAKLYGGAPPKLQEICSWAKLPISMAQAKGFDSWFTERYPGIAVYSAAMWEYAQEHGFVRTWFGRMRRLWGIYGNTQQRLEAARQAANTPVQGTAGDIMKLWIARLDARLDGMGADIVMSVHDELVVECWPADADYVIAAARDALVGLMPIDLPVEAQVGEHWN